MDQLAGQSGPQQRLPGEDSRPAARVEAMKVQYLIGDLTRLRGCEVKNGKHGLSPIFAHQTSTTNSPNSPNSLVVFSKSIAV
jgi:hypothetical protein